MSPDKKRFHKTEISLTAFQEIAKETQERYGSYYGKHTSVPVVLTSNRNELAAKGISSSISYDIPRGTLVRSPMGYLDEVTGAPVIVQFANPEIVVVKGDPTTITHRNPKEVYREILSHETVHSQTEPLILTGPNDSKLTPGDLGLEGKFDYVQGFKVVSVKPEGRKTEHTREFDEAVTQYLSMSMNDSFNTPSAVLMQMSVHGRGISAGYILEARLLNKVFSSLAIDARQVQKFHQTSDLRGFLDFIGEVVPELRGYFVKAAIALESNGLLQAIAQMNSAMQNLSDTQSL